MTRLEAVIAAGQALSGLVDLNFEAVVGLYVPTITSATLTLQASQDGINWFDIRNYLGDAFEMVAGTGGAFFPMVPLELQGVRYLRIRSGTAAVPVNQVAQRVFTVITRVIPR